MRQKFWMMTRCFNCGRWFAAERTINRYCSPACAAAVKYARDRERLAAKPGPLKKFLGWFTCPYCGKVVERQARNQATCYERSCQKAHEKKSKAAVKQRGGPITKKIKSKDHTHAGPCRCLRCERVFHSTDKRYIRVCPKCRPYHEMAQEEYKFATYDGVSL